MGLGPHLRNRLDVGRLPTTTSIDMKRTVIVVPEARSGHRTFRLSNRQALAATGLVVALAVLAVFTTWTFFSNQVASAELERVRSENDGLRQVNQEFERNLRQLRSSLADYEIRTEQLAIVAGLDFEGGSGEAGIGGSDANIQTTDEMTPPGDLARYAERVDLTLDRVAAHLEASAQRISATPSIAPAKGLLTSAYGYRSDPITGDRSLHRGIDIGTAPNRPVRATADGIVTRTGRDGALGTAVSMSHGFGIVTRYGHLSRVVVEPGQQVRQGDLVGYVGKSGRATGYHLHYEVRVDGRPVNPLGYVLDGLGGS